MAKAAGKAAPAVAVVGALAAVPQVRDFVTSAAAGVTAGQRPAGHQSDPGQVASAAEDNAQSFKVHACRPRPEHQAYQERPAGHPEGRHLPAPARPSPEQPSPSTEQPLA